MLMFCTQQCTSYNRAYITRLLYQAKTLEFSITRVTGIPSATSIIFQTKNALKSLASHWGSLQRSPRHPSQLGGASTLPRPHPFGACRVLILTPLALDSAPTAYRFRSQSICVTRCCTPSAASDV